MTYITDGAPRCEDTSFGADVVVGHHEPEALLEPSK